MSAGWVDPDNNGDDPWGAKDEPSSKPLPARKPLVGLFSGVTHVPPSCPRCGGEVVERKRDGAKWCRACARAFYPHSPAGLLFGLGFWYL